MKFAITVVAERFYLVARMYLGSVFRWNTLSGVPPPQGEKKGVFRWNTLSGVPPPQGGEEGCI